MLRDDGTPAQVGDTVRIERGVVHFDPPNPKFQVGNIDASKLVNDPDDSQFVTYLKPEDHAAFLDALDNPKPPTEALKRLMRVHRTDAVGQTRKASLVETVTSTAIGFVVSLVLTATVMPAFGYPTTWSHDLWITVIFTVASIVRGYGVRRSFETGLWRRWIRG